MTRSRNAARSASPSLPRDIICFGTDWYSPSKVSVRQMADVLYERGSRILWVNPVPIRFPRTKGRQLWGKLQNKAQTHARILAHPAPRLHVFSPLYLPLFRGPGFRLNRVLISAQILCLRLFLGMRKPLIMGAGYTIWFALPAVKRRPLLFHFADKISAFRDVSDDPQRRRLLDDMEQAIVDAATLATCSSRLIHAHVAGCAGDDGDKARYLPHAMRAKLFAGCADAVLEIPEELAPLSRPIAGYFGSLTHTNDIDIFRAAAAALPRWSFVFIGRVSGDYSTLSALPNVHFLGPRDHGRIPAYGAAFDVCFMGWKAHEWISNCFPLKTLEYLALGKPVVCSSAIPELAERYPDLVTIATSAEEFTAALQRAVREDTPALRRSRHEAVAGDTWEGRVDEVLAWLEDRGADYAAG